jgi:hypothetical protein
MFENYGQVGRSSGLFLGITPAKTVLLSGDARFKSRFQGIFETFY